MIVDAINNNQMPKLRSSWKYIQNQMNDKACEDAIELVQSEVNKLNDMPRQSIGGMDDLMNRKKEIKDTAIKHFIKNSIMLDREEKDEYV